MDRRRHNRKKYQAPVDYVAFNKLHHGNIGDISPGGMFIDTESKLEPGIWMTIYFNLPGSFNSIRGRVVRSEENGLGVAFMSGFEKKIEPLVDKIVTWH